MARLRRGFEAGRELGLRPLLHYAWYQAGLRSGRYRRATPITEWVSKPLRDWLSPEAPDNPAAFLRSRRAFQDDSFFFPALETPAKLLNYLRASSDEARAGGDEVRAGKLRLFGGELRPVGWPPNWLGAPKGASPVHWSDVDLEAEDDIRLTWEPARFGFVYPLARAYRLHRDPATFETFWEGFKSWRKSAPIHAGPHWVSGQEVALRALALTTAWYAFGSELEARPDAAGELAAAIAVHAARIPPTMSYARAQGNNHVLSEAAALYTIGLLFPEFKAARRWAKTGREAFLEGLARQVYEDGGYVQHSTRYHRLVVDLCLWTSRLAAMHRQPFPDRALERCARLTECLQAQVDPETGVASHLGHDDGSVFFPFTFPSGQDYRFSLQAASLWFRSTAAYPPGPWDELAAWLGLEPKDAQALSPGLPETFPSAGIHILQKGRSKAQVHCVHFRSRPAHSDQLHVEAWFDGSSLIGDPGTYRYRAAPPWDNALAFSHVHNGPMIDGEEPMQRAGRFLWLRWAQGRVIGRWRTPEGDLEAVLCEHDGYRRMGIRVRRAVIRAGSDGWLISDEVEGSGRHTITTCWLLPPEAHELAGDLGEVRLGGRLKIRMEGPDRRLGLYQEGRFAGGEDVESTAENLGWRSPTYNSRAPGLTAVFHCADVLPVHSRVWITIGNGSEPLFEPGPPSLHGSRVSWNGRTLQLG
ncbi:MAG: alginate lyase family protein [Anaerolineales bacterium]